MTEVLANYPFFVQWLSIVGPLTGLFLFVHKENTSLTKRLDETIHNMQINHSEINKRCDDLHREFYELLKELRKEN